MTLTIILKNGKELTTTWYPQDKMEEFTNVLSDKSVEFITFANTDNWNIILVRLEDISAVLYGIS